MCIKTEFKNPEAIFRSAPLWAWNDNMTKEQIEFQLQELSTHGFGGAFVHPRPGLVTEYLSNAWFDLWKHALETAKSLNMYLYIYDENSYPSGFAGGHVPASMPEAKPICAAYGLFDSISDVAGKSLISVYSCTVVENKIKILSDLTHQRTAGNDYLGDKLFVIYETDQQPNAWNAGFTYVDLLNPDVVRRFLDVTYEKYFDYFGSEFGKAIPAIFSDEPLIGACGKDTIPVNQRIYDYFYKINGYKMQNYLPCIFKDVQSEIFEKSPCKVRFDYYKTLRLMWTENCIIPISDWCSEHGIVWTGHYFEHQWPLPHAHNISPSIQSNYEFHKWPGVDLLLSSYLKDSETNVALMFLRELLSSSNQFQKERTLCELYGAGGWDSSFEDYKRMADFVLVNGVNFINQHLTYATIAGSRKRDHPQSFDWRQSWWDEYKTLNDYTARASAALSKGKMKQRVLLLNSSTTGYIIPASEAKGEIYSHVGDGAIENPNMDNYLQLVQMLTDEQIDFDIGDEFSIARHGKVCDRHFKIAKGKYEVVVISGDMKNILSSTVKLLNLFLEVGGTVICVGEPLLYVDGDRLSEPLILEGEVKRVNKNSDAVRVVKKLAVPRIKSSIGFYSGVNHMLRFLDNGSILLFFVNHSFSSFDTTIKTSGKTIAKLNLFSGECEKIKYTSSGKFIEFELHINRNQSALYIINDGDESISSQDIEDKIEIDVPLKLLNITAEKQNYLPIDYCDLKIDDEEYLDVFVQKASDVVFKHRGFNSNPWDSGVQYKRQLIDRNTYGLDSGFVAKYHFNISSKFGLKKLFVIVERPKLCRIEINGKAACITSDACELDHNLGVFDISENLKIGDNTITLIADKFDVLLELEPIYIIGDFAVKILGSKFVIDVAEVVGYGDLADQGYKFYPYAVNYNYECTVCDNTNGKFKLVMDDFSATAAALYVNNAFAGIFAIDGNRELFINDYLKSEKNEISIRLCGSMKNLLGPHHAGSQRGTAWPSMWRLAPESGKPTADKYDYISFGINHAPVLLVETTHNIS